MVATSRSEPMRSLNTRMGMPLTSSVTTSKGPPGPVSCCCTSALVGTIRTLLLRPRGNDSVVSLPLPLREEPPMAKVAFVLADDFEDSEFKVPYDRIRAAGHEVTVIGTEAGKEVKGKKGKETFELEATPGDVDPAQFDALVVPGG